LVVWNVDVCVVVECPSFQYLDSLVTNRQLLKYTSRHQSEDEFAPCLIVHLTPADVVASNTYQSWMSLWVDSHFTLSLHSSLYSNSSDYSFFELWWLSGG